MIRRDFALENREVKTHKKRPVSLETDALGLIERFRTSIRNIDDRFRLYHVLIGQRLYEEAEDLLRFQIVYLMSALDFFMHELYSYGILKIFQHQKRKTERYKSFRVPLELVEQALFDGENIQHHLKKMITEINQTFTFMHPSRIKELLHTIGYADAFSKAQRVLRKKGILRDGEALAPLLEKIYIRRNKISHQTDIEHGGPNRLSISLEEVRHYRDVIFHAVETIYETVCHDIS